MKAQPPPSDPNRAAENELSQHIDELDSLLSIAKQKRKKKKKMVTPGEFITQKTEKNFNKNDSKRRDQKAKSDNDYSLLGENLELPVKRRGKKRKNRNTNDSLKPMEKKCRTDEPIIANIR